MGNSNAKTKLLQFLPPVKTPQELQKGANLILSKLPANTNGLKCWQKFIKTRSRPEKVLPEEPLTSRFAGPQGCKNRDVLAGFVPEIGDVREKLEAKGEAMLAPLEHSYNFFTSRQLVNNVTSLALFDSGEVDGAGGVIAKFMLAQFEWETLYSSCKPTHLYDWIHFINMQFAEESHLASFENLMVIVKWLAIAFEKHIAKSKANILLGRRSLLFNYLLGPAWHLTVEELPATEWEIASSIVSLLARLCNLPLDGAQSCEFKKCLSRILAVKWRNSSGKDLLTYACMCCTAWHHEATGSDKLVQLLVELGADVNTMDGDGNTCLHHLLNSTLLGLKNPAIVQFLLDNGADPDVPNKEGITAREFFHSGKLCGRANDTSIVEHILNNGPNLDTVNLLSKMDVWVERERTDVVFPPSK